MKPRNKTEGKRDKNETGNRTETKQDKKETRSWTRRNYEKSLKENMMDRITEGTTNGEFEKQVCYASKSVLGLDSLK